MRLKSEVFLLAVSGDLLAAKVDVTAEQVLQSERAKLAIVQSCSALAAEHEVIVCGPDETPTSCGFMTLWRVRPHRCPAADEKSRCSSCKARLQRVTTTASAARDRYPS